MKRLALLLVVALFATEASAGLLPKAKFGIKAGMNFQTNDIKAIDQVKFDAKSGWFAGAQGDIWWGFLGVRPEIIYSQNAFDVVGLDGKLKMNNLDIPLLAQIKILGVLSIHAGPTFCVMTNAGGKANGYEWHIDRPTVGYAVGAEAKIWKIAISARYNGAFKESKILGFEAATDKIGNIQIGVGYYF